MKNFLYLLFQQISELQGVHTLRIIAYEPDVLTLLVTWDICGELHGYKTDYRIDELKRDDNLVLIKEFIKNANSYYCRNN